jgi:small subunit ribosomal protein S4
MQIGPKFKICRRLGPGVFEKCQSRRFTMAETRAPRSKRGRGGARSDFAIQQLEKQKMRFTYGLSEKQFSRYVKDSVARKKTNATEQLLSTLESRLDNVVYRMGFARTRRQARQYVSHGHILVNGVKTTIPSCLLRAGDTISIREASKQKHPFSIGDEEKGGGTTPTWLSVDLSKKEGKLAGAPLLRAEDVFFDPAAVIEFYSR